MPRAMTRGKETSKNLRKKNIADCYNRGEGCKKLAKHFGVSRTGARAIIKKFKTMGTVEHVTSRGRKENISQSLKRD